MTSIPEKLQRQLFDMVEQIYYYGDFYKYKQVDEYPRFESYVINGVLIAYYIDGVPTPHEIKISGFFGDIVISVLVSEFDPAATWNFMIEECNANIQELEEYLVEFILAVGN